MYFLRYLFWDTLSWMPGDRGGRGEASGNHVRKVGCGSNTSARAGDREQNFQPAAAAAAAAAQMDREKQGRREERGGREGEGKIRIGG